MKLTHLNASGAAHMVDVGGKASTHRSALAEGCICMQPQTLRMIYEHGHPKGDVFGTARIAGLLAAKKTADLIPLCHPLPISHAEIEFSSKDNTVCCRARVQTCHQTGVEMEALTAVQIALLTLYDMCKAVDRSMCIRQVRLLEKSGGRSGYWKNPEA